MDPNQLEELLRRGETQTVEIKGVCAFDGDLRPHLTATIAALSNSAGGGTVVVGVEQTTWVIQGLSEAQVASFDVTKIAHYLKERLAPLPRITVEQVAHLRGTVLLVQVPEFDDVPVVVVKQIADSKQKVYANEGDVLIRSRSCECRRIKSADEMRELLSRALTKRNELLLRQIRDIITGVPPTVPAVPPDDLLQSELPDWAATVDEWRSKQRPAVAWWEVNLLPMPSVAQVFEPQRLVEVIRASAVSWRGWYYPTFGVKAQDFAYLPRYARFAYDGDEQSERWQVSYAGAFASVHALHLDLIPQSPDFRHQPPPNRLIDFIDVCWSFAEFFRFATSYAEALGLEGLWVRIALRTIDGRPLGAFDPRYLPWHQGAAHVRDIVQAQVFTQADLASGWREHALTWTKHVLTVFQWPEADRAMLSGHQTRLMERRW